MINIIVEEVKKYFQIAHINEYYGSINSLSKMIYKVNRVYINDSDLLHILKSMSQQKLIEVSVDNHSDYSMKATDNCQDIEYKIIVY